MRDAAIAKVQKEADALMAGAEAQADKVIQEAESKESAEVFQLQALGTEIGFLAFYVGAYSNGAPRSERGSQ